MLNREDVCDRCGAVAYVLALFDGGAVLTFCGHHGRALATALDTAALAVYDETHRLAR
jgi:hypothetical protein